MGRSFRPGAGQSLILEQETRRSDARGAQASMTAVRATARIFSRRLRDFAQQSATYPRRYSPRYAYEGSDALRQLDRGRPMVF